MLSETIGRGFNTGGTIGVAYIIFDTLKIIEGTDETINNNKDRRGA